MKRPKLETDSPYDIIPSNECGVAHVSKANLLKLEPRLGDITKIEGVYAGDRNNGDFYVYVTGTIGGRVRVSGFSWGYGGEGPHGLEWLVCDFARYEDPETAWPEIVRLPCHEPIHWTWTRESGLVIVSRDPIAVER